MTHLASGVIALWSGSIASIPPGWLLCDGNNDTPDLRDRFLVGAGDSFAVNDNGGSVNHNHPFTGNLHDHTLIDGSGLTPGSAKDLTTSETAVTGTTDNTNGLPPYFALAYIMKS